MASVLSPSSVSRRERNRCSFSPRGNEDVFDSDASSTSDGETDIADTEDLEQQSATIVDAHVQTPPRRPKLDVQKVPDSVMIDSVHREVWNACGGLLQLQSCAAEVDSKSVDRSEPARSEDKYCCNMFHETLAVCITDCKNKVRFFCVFYCGLSLV